MERRKTKMRSLDKRFWGRVTKTRYCWFWDGAKNPQGYGKIFIQGSQYMSTHRVAWTLKHGHIPEGLSVLHKCDSPSCVRPSHLFIGTQSDNMIDCHKKGRLKFPDNRGARYGAAKLNDKKALKIRALCANSGLTQKEIGKLFHVSRETVSSVSRRITWRHV